MAKKKTKTKIIYRTKKPVEPSFDKKKEELKKEIKELQEKKSNVPKGFKGFIQRGAINKAISEKSKILRSERGSEAMKQRTKQVRSQIEFQRSKNELQELQGKNKVNFGGFGSSGPKKQLKFEDLS